MERADYKRLKEFYESSNMAESPGVDEDSNITDSEQVHNFRLAAKVIAVEPTDWFRYLTIDKGKNEVAEGMAVITWSDSVMDTPYLTGAVIGKVVNVYRRSAKVQLITDRLSIVAVTIGSQGDLALMSGQPVKGNCVIDEILLTTHDMLKEGDAVVVDERSSVFPPGMLVGWISSIEEKGIEEKGTYFCRIVIEPAFKFNKLREVMVLRDN
jgi:rod shape-determining protein MreC